MEALKVSRGHTVVLKQVWEGRRPSSSKSPMLSSGN
jgi:hypothetical protein